MEAEGWVCSPTAQREVAATVSLVQFCWTQAGFGGILGILSMLTVQCWDIHMFLHRCPPSSSLVDSLSKASYLARPYVLGHGDSGMWKEQRVILGLQTPSGAIPSKFCWCRDPELLIPHHRSHQRPFLPSFVKTRVQKATSLCSIPKPTLAVHSLDIHPKPG